MAGAKPHSDPSLAIRPVLKEGSRPARAGDCRAPAPGPGRGLRAVYLIDYYSKRTSASCPRKCPPGAIRPSRRHPQGIVIDPPSPKISVALLTKNGGRALRECVDAVCAQEFAAGFEIVAIDSGSSDGSDGFLAANPRISLHRIGPGEFQHGRTRNLAMARTRGELVAFLTQDAIPADGRWLAEMVAFMDAHPEVAGAFGHQVPHLDADPLEAWEVAVHFDSFRHGPEVFTATPEWMRSAGVGERVRLHYFSNVNSCIRRSAWQRLPFPELDFGEDQAWARQALSSGLATGYARRAVVRHSHNYGPLALFRRRYEEARLMHREFGFPLFSTWRQAAAAARADGSAFQGELRRLAPSRGGASPLRAWSRAWASALGRLAGTRLAFRDGPFHDWLSLTESHRRG